MIILSIIFLEALALYLASNVKHAPALQTVIVTNMLLITLFGGFLADFGGVVSNYGSIFYATVMCAQYIIVRRGGWQDGVGCFGAVLGALTLSVVVTVAMAAGSMVSGNEQTAAIYTAVIKMSSEFAVSSFGAFIAGQIVFIGIYSLTANRGVWLNYGVNIIVAQAVDSIIFFTAAFWGNSQMWGIMLAGYGVKVAVGLLALPILLWVDTMGALRESREVLESKHSEALRKALTLISRLRGEITALRDRG